MCIHEYMFTNVPNLIYTYFSESPAIYLANIPDV